MAFASFLYSSKHGRLPLDLRLQGGLYSDSLGKISFSSARWPGTLGHYFTLHPGLLRYKMAVTVVPSSWDAVRITQCDTHGALGKDLPVKLLRASLLRVAGDRPASLQPLMDLQVNDFSRAAQGGVLRVQSLGSIRRRGRSCPELLLSLGAGSSTVCSRLLS